MTQLSHKIECLYNRIFISLLKEIKTDSYIKLLIKKYYNKIQKGGNQYIIDFIALSLPKLDSLLVMDDVVNDSSFIDWTLIQHISNKRLINGFKDNFNPILHKLYIMFLLAYMHTHIVSDDVTPSVDCELDKNGELECLLIESFKIINKEIELSSTFSELSDDTVKALLDKIMALNVLSSSFIGEDDESTTSSPMDDLTNSSIGKLAESLSKNLNLDGILNNPDIQNLDFNTIMKNPLSILSNPALTGLIQNIGSNLGSAIQDSNISQEELFNDASQLMNNSEIQNMMANPDIQNLMNSVKTTPQKSSRAQKRAKDRRDRKHS